MPSIFAYTLPLRPGQVVAAASEFVELVRKAANSWPSIKPWINASDIEELLSKVVGGSAVCPVT